MTFLAPAAGIIGAAITLPALLLLYLLRLRRRPLRVSSTLLWEQAAQDLQVNVPLRMLKWSWLLLLHLIALACFIVAIARPAMGDGGTVGSRIVIIVDRSASMNATDAAPATPGGPPRSRLDAAKDRARKLIDSIGRSGAGAARPRCMVVSMAAAPQALTGFTPDLRALREAVEAITPTDQPDNLAATLQLIDAMTTEAESEQETGTAKPTVYLITDGVVPPPAAVDRHGLNPSVLLVMPPGTESADPRVNNVGIVAVSAQHDIEDAGLIRVFARLINAGPTAIAAAMRCTVDGDLPTDGVASVSLPAARVDAAGKVISGEAAAVFAVRPRPSQQPRTIIVSIARPDLLAADDAGGVVLAPPWRPRILLVAPDPAPPATAPEPDVFLLQAVEATEPASLRVVGAQAIQPIPVVAGGATAPSPWAGADIVIFDRVEPPANLPLPAVPTLTFGAGLPQIGLVVRGSDSAIQTARAMAWKRDHPTLRYVGLDTLLVAPAASIELPAAQAGVGVNRKLASLVDGTAGPLIVEAVERSADGGTIRRIVVAFDLSRSNWGPDISFPLFVGNTVAYFAADADDSGGHSASNTTMDAPSVKVPAGCRAIVASGANAIEFQLSGDAAEERSVSVGPFAHAGVYLLRTSDGRPVSPEAVVVNLASERESQLLPQLDSINIPAGDAKQAGSEGGPREVWHWFILAALVPLTIEWFVYAWRMRG